MEQDDPKIWTRGHSERGPDLLIARVRFDWVTNPRTEQQMKRVVLESPDWVNVVARTAEGRIVCVRQYRFGTDTVTTEIPGGMVDPGETSREAAERELREETGYTASNWQSLGNVHPNPAFQTNRCHFWLAEGAVPSHEQEMDPGEDIAVRLLSVTEVLAGIRSGEISHSLVICAIARVLDLRDPNRDWR